MAQDQSRTAAKAGNLELEAYPGSRPPRTGGTSTCVPRAQHRPRPLRLEQPGATAPEHHEHHTVMADPQGSEFSAEPAQHSSNSRQRTRPTRGIERVQPAGDCSCAVSTGAVPVARLRRWADGGSAASLRMSAVQRGGVVSRGGSSGLDLALAACCQIKIKVSGRLSGNSCSGAPVLGQ